MKSMFMMTCAALIVLTSCSLMMESMFKQKELDIEIKYKETPEEEPPLIPQHVG